MKYIILGLFFVSILMGKNIDKDLSKKAQAANKMILIEATSSYCGYCVKMKKNVLQDKEVQDFINKKYIFQEVYVDANKLPFDLDKEFGGMTPTFFILESNGKLVKQIPGSWGKEDFLDFIK